MSYRRIYWAFCLGYTDDDGSYKDIQLTIVFLDLDTIWQRKLVIGNLLSKDVWMREERFNICSSEYSWHESSTIDIWRAGLSTASDYPLMVFR
jgi:hypothetical protein